MNNETDYCECSSQDMQYNEGTYYCTECGCEIDPEYLDYLLELSIGEKFEGAYL
jgi:transcription initiation factor TFIIIB Brf1 subunit/transcription initiation factor TFIIB